MKGNEDDNQPRKQASRDEQQNTSEPLQEERDPSSFECPPMPLLQERQSSGLDVIRILQKQRKNEGDDDQELAKAQERQVVADLDTKKNVMRQARQHHNPQSACKIDDDTDDSAHKKTNGYKAARRQYASHSQALAANLAFLVPERDASHTLQEMVVATPEEDERSMEDSNLEEDMNGFTFVVQRNNLTAPTRQQPTGPGAYRVEPPAARQVPPSALHHHDGSTTSEEATVEMIMEEGRIPPLEQQERPSNASLAVASLVRSIELGQAEEISLQQEETLAARKRNTVYAIICWLILGGCLLLLFAGVVVSATFLVGGSASPPAEEETTFQVTPTIPISTPPPTPTASSYLRTVLPDFSLQEMRFDNTPQSKAFKWLESEAAIL